jgi:hypothetical protein
VASLQAINALKVIRGTDCLVADSAQAFADSLIKLLNDEVLRAQMGAAGRRFVETHHNWDDIVAQLEHIYERSMQDVREPIYPTQTSTPTAQSHNTKKHSSRPISSATQT